MNDLLLFDIDEDIRAPSIPTSRMKSHTMFGVLVWFVGALVAGWSGVFSQQGGPPTYLALFISVPLVVFAALSFPVSLIPTFFVPLFILLHVLALIRRNEVGGARES
jgi:hypothetical protein